MGLHHKHDLPILQEQLEQLHLTFMHKIVEGLMPAIPADAFLTPQKRRRQMRSRRSSYQQTLCPVTRHKTTSETMADATQCHTATSNNFFFFFFYKHPFYPITITAWNTVNSDRTKCFKSALLSAKRRQTNNRCAPQPVAPIPDS